MVDSHSHIFNEYYDNIRDVLNRAKDNGINKVIVAADNIKSCKEIIKHAQVYDNYYICLGIHPENVDDDIDELIKLLEENKDNNKLVAIGEIGLDYYWTKDNKEKQKELFIKQLELARKYNLPCVIHSREAINDTIEILKDYKDVVKVMHCFTGSYETAKIYIDLNCYLGIGGVLTFKNSKLKDNIVKLPLDKLILETDSPYLSPEPVRGTHNEPANIKFIAEFLAKLYDTDIKEIEEKTNKNIQKIFHI